MRRLLIWLALACGAWAPSSLAATLYGWTEYAAAGALEARAVTDGPACPLLRVDGSPHPMAERHGPDQAFAVRVCRAVLPPGTAKAEIDGKPLALPVAHPRRIVVLGDTGCRLKKQIIQACNDPAAWPFRRVSELAAGEKPDLVIHVGDYHYRETPCPAGDGRCAGSPWGDNWPTWDADFFAPAAPLLAAAPWLAMRGNHEECKRAGIGWTQLLGADPITAPCALHERPRVVDLGGLRLVAIDDSDADDAIPVPKPEVVARLHDDIGEALQSGRIWLLFHHPVRGVEESGTQGRISPGANPTLIAAFAGLEDSKVQMILSGHIHTFQVADYADGHPPQLIAGIGGDLLDRQVPPKLAGLRTGDTRIQQGSSIPAFGYLVLVRGAKSWSIAIHAADGHVEGTCRLAGRRLSCPGA